MSFARVMARFLLPLLLAVIAAAAPKPSDGFSTTNYVLVGGGPAGFVLAEYLTRNPKVNVVLLEAGPNFDNNINVTEPGNLFNIIPFVDLYLSQPDPGLGGLTPDVAQARMVGGGSGCNAMIYCRGSASVFDEWASISGNNGLKWSSMLDAFKATSHFKDEASIKYSQPVNASSFGSGPLEITRQRELFPFDQPFANKMASQFNLPTIDFMSGGGIGVTQGLGSIRASNRTRSYAYDTFGYLSNLRPNFQLRANAKASKIGFSGTTANSVTYNDTTTNTMHTINAKEIIVTAGAIDSPQLLMLSGVGPAAQLQKVGIKVVQDTPQVGQNLIDHHFALQQYQTIASQPTLWQLENNKTFLAQEQQRYAKDGSGSLGTNYGDVFGAYRLPNSVFTGTGSYFTNLPSDRPHVGYEYTSAPTVDPTTNVTSLSVWSALVQPESSGNITLKTADYRDFPIIFSNYYGTAGEKAAALYGYKQLRSVMNSNELKPYLPKEIFPGANVTSDADIWKAIQKGSRSWHHPVGTTALGTVLGADWRVKGLKGLRVVGASAMPKIPTCPIQASVYALASRAAVDIAAADQW